MWREKIKQILLRLHIPSIFSFVIILGQLNGSGSNWSAPDTIPGYHPETWPPVLVADQNRTVHAFSSQWVGEGSDRVIMYNRWTYDQGWTLPVNILLSPLKEARILDAYLDPTGMMHLIFWGGDNTYANIYYTRCAAIDAANPYAWLSPVLVAPDAGDPESGVILWDENDTLGIVFHGRNDGEGIYGVFSSDNGGSWSDAEPIFLSGSAELYPTRLKSGRSESGASHVVWNMGNESGQGRGLYYTSIDPGAANWGEPLLLDVSPEGLGTDRPVIIEHKGVLYVIYINMGIKMRTSSDGGLSWGSITKLFTRHVGYNGSLAPVIDGKGDLHLFFGQRISGSPDIHGMWHSQLLNNRWTEPDPVTKGTLVVDKEGGNAYDPYEARAVISQGNTILVIWRTDFASKGNGVWYSYKRLDIPELSVLPLPPLSFEVEENDIAHEVESVELDSQTTNENTSPYFGKENNSVESYSNPGIPIVSGILLATTFALLVLLIKLFKVENPTPKR